MSVLLEFGRGGPAENVNCPTAYSGEPGISCGSALAGGRRILVLVVEAATIARRTSRGALSAVGLPCRAEPAGSAMSLTTMRVQPGSINRIADLQSCNLVALKGVQTWSSSNARLSRLLR